MQNPGCQRTVEAEITLRHSFEGMGRTSEETSHQRTVSSLGPDGTNHHGAISGDHAGHIAAHRFMLDQGLTNLFAQNGNFNTSAYKKMENEWAALVSGGHEIEGRITFEFDSHSNRPSDVGIKYTSPGLEKPQVKIYENKSGETFHRSKIK